MIAIGSTAQIAPRASASTIATHRAARRAASTSIGFGVSRHSSGRSVPPGADMRQRVVEGRVALRHLDVQEQRDQRHRAAAPAAAVDEDVAALAPRIGVLLRKPLLEGAAQQVEAREHHRLRVPRPVDQAELVVAHRPDAVERRARGFRERRAGVVEVEVHRAVDDRGDAVRRQQAEIARALHAADVEAGSVARDGGLDQADRRPVVPGSGGHAPSARPVAAAKPSAMPGAAAMTGPPSASPPRSRNGPTRPPASATRSSPARQSQAFMCTSA